MNKYQKWLIVSIIFLATALVMPIYVFYSSLGATIKIVESSIPPNFQATQQAAQAQLLVVVVAVEAILVACFAVTFWYAIKCRDQCRSYPLP